MIPNHSPWIKQLARKRPVVPIAKDVSTDVLVVGGGIAGVVTAYFTLRNTDKNVVLIEADKIAHGATGHNAGQITSYFERPLHELVDEFGIRLAAEGQKAVESAWILLDEIVAEASLQTPLHRFTGYTGITTEEQLISTLKDNACRVRGQLPTETILVAEESPLEKNIPPEFKNLYSLVPQKDLLGLLETDNRAYIACISYQKGCTNSALFSEELVGYLLTKYKKRFSLFEGSPVRSVTLEKERAYAESGGYILTASRVVLCTNGFENFSIINTVGQEIDTKFHHLVNGRIGYMAGYVEPLHNPPTAISYFPKNTKPSGDPTGESYFYLTRRPHEHEGTPYNLVCTGGPEKVLPDQALYVRDDGCDEDARERIDEFLRDSYKNYPAEGTEYAFCWHGLMGYTPSGTRRIGPEPVNPVLLYNLGCNGVGILPSIYGGQRISQFLNGEALPPSMFDPHDQSSTPPVSPSR